MGAEWVHVFSVFNYYEISWKVRLFLSRLQHFMFRNISLRDDWCAGNCCRLVVCAEKSDGAQFMWVSLSTDTFTICNNKYMQTLACVWARWFMSVIVRWASAECVSWSLVCFAKGVRVWPRWSSICHMFKTRRPDLPPPSVTLPSFLLVSITLRLMWVSPCCSTS